VVARLITVAAVSFLAAAGPTRADAGSSVCQQLVERAQALKNQAWADGSKALFPALQINEAKRAPTKGVEATVANDPAILEAIDTQDGQWTVFVDHMAGSNLYAASTSKGTLHCQTYAFARARPGGPVTVVDGPSGPVLGGEAGDLCWTRTANFGRVLGQPAFIEHGANDQATDDEDLRITPWADGRWSPACTLKLRFWPVFTISQRHCGDSTVCAVADKDVLAIASAYYQFRQSERDSTDFQYSGAVSGKVPPDIERALQMLGPDSEALELPTFSAKADSAETAVFSYSGLSYFPLTLNGRTYVAAIGHEGVGWRESATTLFAIYTVKGDDLVPEAGYAIDRTIGGLKAASTQ
jgi:hypothetical protein